jgi:hypothetical protein
MKYILMLIVFIFLVGCGVNVEGSNGTDIAINTETNISEDINNSDKNITDNNSSSTLSIDDIKGYLTDNSEYQLTPIGNENENSIKDYIKHNQNYSIEPLEKLSRDNVKIFYEFNKSIVIPKKIFL